LRMKLRGTVDFHERVNTRVEASVLRNVWLLGPIISTTLSPLTKLFEYKVTGTLDDPKAAPMHLPKFMLAPLSPFQTLKDIFAPGQSRTNAPVFAEPP